MKIQNILLLTMGIFLFLSSFSSVFAAEKLLQLTFDPPSANFSAGEKSIVYITLEASGDNISAATVTVRASGGINITDILSPVDVSNKLISDTKVINKKVSDSAASATILLVKNTADLPTLIKIPVVVTNGKGIVGKVKLDVKKSEVVDAEGEKYKLSEPKEATVSFSEVGQINNPAPSPTPLPRNSIVLNISTRLQGIDTGNLKKKTLENVKVQLVQQNGKTTRSSAPTYITLTVGNNGIWQGSAVLTGVSAGNYQVLIKGPNHLQKKICENTPSENAVGKYECNTFGVKLTSGQNTVDVTGIRLMVGDVGLQDGVLNAYDLSFIQNVIRKSSHSDVDVNGDGKTDKKDYDLMVYSLINTSGLDQK